MHKINQIKIALSKHPELTGILERLEVLDNEMIQLQMDLAYVIYLQYTELEDEVGEEGMKALAELEKMVDAAILSLFGQGWI